MASRRKGLAAKNYFSAVSIGVIQKNIFTNLCEKGGLIALNNTTKMSPKMTQQRSLSCEAFLNE